MMDNFSGDQIHVACIFDGRFLLRNCCTSCMPKEWLNSENSITVDMLLHLHCEHNY